MHLLNQKKAFTLKRRSIAWFNVGWLIVVGGSFLGCRAEQIRCRPILLRAPHQPGSEKVTALETQDTFRRVIRDIYQVADCLR